MPLLCEQNDLLVFSHIRWNFAFQRPQHLMSRFAKYRRVFFIESPIFEAVSFPKIHTHQGPDGVFVLTPYLPQSFARHNQNAVLSTLIDELLMVRNIYNYNIWYYTPMALPISRHLNPKHILYDLVDDLSLDEKAPQILKELESELLSKAHLIFTAGSSLYKAKRFHHSNIYSFPNSIDKTHFGQARMVSIEDQDLTNIPHPQIGYFGVIDERLDFKLIADIAKLRPNFQFIFLGPIGNIEYKNLPQASNIHYLGPKGYLELPRAIAHWNCAIMPYILNKSTRYLCPTKTLEFLTAGLPVVSTALEDVVTPFGNNNLVQIAHSAEDFSVCLEKSLKDKKNVKWKIKVDSFLAELSWDITWEKMAELEKEIGLIKTTTNPPRDEINYTDDSPQVARQDFNT